MAVVPAGNDAGTAVPLVVFESPEDGAVFGQNTLSRGEWAAEVAFRIHAQNVAKVEVWSDGEFLLGEADAAGELSYAFHEVGSRSVAAIGYDAAGTEVARDEIEIAIEPPLDTSCHAALDAIGLDWTVVSPTPGVSDPVRVEPFINGVSFRYISNDEPTAMLMDCQLAIRLHHLTEILIPYGIDEVIHIGIYNYRCIGGGNPDMDACTPSQHAYARAIDLHAFRSTESGVTYSTETDFEITVRGDSCPIPSFSEADRILKEIACTMWSDRIFQVVLTPNYNAAHRNHYHVDLSEGSMYLGVGVEGVDPIVDGLGH